MPPKISVLVTVYNGEKFLDECLESILAQDFQDFELLISDDRSADGSCAILERFAGRDPRIRWWRNPVNLGLAGNFNHCLKSATGEYVKYVLHDDKLICNSALRTMAAMLDANPNVTLVASAAEIIDGQSSHLEWRDNFRKTGVIPGRKVIARCLEEDKNLIGEPSVVMFRRTQAARGYHPEFYQLIDLELWCHLLENGNLGYINEPLCAFRKHAAQESAAEKAMKRHIADYTRLMQDYLTRPWMRGSFSRRAQFRLIYNMRRRKLPEEAKPAKDLLRAMGSSWYTTYWLWHKAKRPFQNLGKWFSRRVGGAPQRPAPAGAAGASSGHLARLNNFELDLNHPDYLVYRGLFADLKKAAPHAKGRLLDIGCGNKPYEKMFAGKVTAHLGCDVVQSSDRRVDYICPATKLTVDDATFDTVLATQVIEHVADHQALLAEAFRVLKPDGVLILSGPMYWPLHEEPHDYFRFTKYGFRHLLEKTGFTRIDIMSNGGKWALCGQVLVHNLRESWLDRPLVTRGINRFFARLDDRALDTGDTMNYVVVAHKPAAQAQKSP